MTKQIDPPSLGPCPYCHESVRKAGGKYLDLGLEGFVPHRHQPQKAQAEPDPMRASPGESSGD